MGEPDIDMIVDHKDERIAVFCSVVRACNAFRGCEEASNRHAVACQPGSSR
jgi:hypothetical protein